LVLLALFSLPGSVYAINCGTTSLGDYHWTASGQVTRANNCLGFSGFRCYAVTGPGTLLEKVNPACDPTAGSCTVKIHATATIPGLRDMIVEDGLFSSLTPWVYWYPCTGAACTQDFVCGLDAFGGRINFDNLDTWLERGLSCAQAVSLNLSVRIRVCASSSCEQSTTIDLPAADLANALGCPKPPRKDDCRDCKSCILTGGGNGGGGCSAGVGGRGPTCKVPASGAHLYYAEGGAGTAGLPGSASWATTLGRNWSHDYAQRIILDPNDSHVWLITERATFREFSNLVSGVYNTESPGDEKRTLRRTGSGWELDELDGTVHTFDSSGFWIETEDRNGNTKTATYASGKLTKVDFPDGRSETFTYHGSGTGKLATLTEAGVGGSPTRTWSYTWTGDDLTKVDRPDGTAWEFFYHSTRPGALIRWDLVGTNSARRVEGAWDYDAYGNVIKAWRGDTSSTGPDVVDLSTFSYTNPALPTQAQVTDPFSKVTTYTIGRDTVSDVPKITQISGDCPVCGTGPNSQFTYADSANPLLPTEIIDGRGLRTQFTYDSNGQMTSKTEAATTGLARTTTWDYSDPNFPAFPTRIEVPSTSGGMALRVTDLSYNASGDLETVTQQGVEAGSAFSFDTDSTFNAAGQPLTVDPPGSGTTDETSYTYDPTRGNLLPLTRTDPIIGATTFAYDGFNRRTSVIDPNGVETVTTYDSLHRITSVTQMGATTPGDLVTTEDYNVFGDRLRTTFPEGNVAEYGYDAAGRLISVEQKPDAVTPGERIFYTLDDVGHRTKEELQRWNGTAWVTDSFTDFVYSSRCHLDKTVNADGTGTEYAYDCNGNLEKVWDANHPKVTNPTPTQLYAYDSLNRAASVTQPWTGAGGSTAVTSYAYDVQDHLIGITDTEGTVTTYTYSDRDLGTQEVSPVSGTTSYEYNEHGNQVEETDARSVTILRTYDDLDRLTSIDYPDPDLDTTYTYDAGGAGAFAKGRLTSIARGGSTVTYTYDRFGRVLQDGAILFSYDKNGNPLSLQYPNAVTATYTYDYADRQATLVMQDGANPSQTLVSASSYKPQGPLASLTLGNGRTETHAFSNRYLPTSISVSGSLLSWSYSNDGVGNPTAITDTLNSANNRTYAYQAPQYFLTTGNGPWGTLSWTYDKIGNRLTETRGLTTDTYSYLVNGTGGNRAQIDDIVPGSGPTATYSYDTVGEVLDNGSQDFFYGDDRRMKRIGTLWPNTTFAYDGRGYLTESIHTPAFQRDTDRTYPTYSSAGLFLHRFAHREPFGLLSASDSDLYVFYFAGRPVATLDNVTTSSTTSTLRYLSTDHLGTPILETNTAGAQVWQGGFEPFGSDYTGANPNTALRFPGQWSDSTWNGNKKHGLYYNVNRWYDTATGRYTQPDPIESSILQPAAYLYAEDRPTALIDPLGLYTVTDNYSEEPTTGAPKFRPDRVDADFKCECCSPGGTGWCLEFRVQRTYRMLLPPGVKKCSIAHERVHIRIFKHWATENAMQNLLPAERRTYNSQAKCQDAGKRAKELFITGLKQTVGAHSRRQSGHDARVFLPEMVTCGPWSD
jgi:RHS repeat-associated protein